MTAYWVKLLSLQQLQGPGYWPYWFIFKSSQSNSSSLSLASKATKRPHLLQVTLDLKSIVFIVLCFIISEFTERDSLF